MSLGLVAYASSDEDGSENDDEVVEKHITLPPKPNENGIAISVRNKTKDDVFLKHSEPISVHEQPVKVGSPSSSPTSSTIFSALPPPSLTPSAQRIEEDELEDEVKMKPQQLADIPKPPKKTKQPVKITIQSLPESDSDEDEPVLKKPKQSNVKSGLTSLLPPPKNVSTKAINRPLIPHTLSKRIVPNAAASVTKPEVSRKTIESPKEAAKQSKASALPGITFSDSEDEDDGSTNFFSLYGDNNRLDMQPLISAPIEPGTAPLHLQDAPLQFRSDKPVLFKPTVQPHISHNVHYSWSQPLTSESMVADESAADSSMYDESGATVSEQLIEEPLLENEQMLRLQGKKHWGKEVMNFIEVNAADQMNNEIDLSKQLTEEAGPQMSYSRKNKDLPSSQQRRKHQITYLAFKAKESELDLKNQWATNRQTRRQTQSKYGF